MKLGRFRVEGQSVYGFAIINKNKILIDSRLKGKIYMDTLIHEKLHLLYPEWSETQVLKTAQQLSTMLWHHSYRRVDNTK